MAGGVEFVKQIVVSRPDEKEAVIVVILVELRPDAEPSKVDSTEHNSDAVRRKSKDLAKCIRCARRRNDDAARKSSEYEEDEDIDEVVEESCDGEAVGSS